MILKEVGPVQHKAIIMGALLVVDLAAVRQDARYFKISNRLLIAGAAAAVLLRTGLFGPDIIPDMAGGLLLPVLLLWPLFMLAMIGAADIKLLMVTGLFLGPAMTARAMVVSAVIAGIWAAVRMTRRHLWRQRFGVLAAYVRGMAMHRTGPYLVAAEAEGKAAWMLPLSAAVFAGTLAVCLSDLFCREL